MNRQDEFLSISRVACRGAVALGVLVLLGWAFDIAFLKTVRPGLSSMKPNTALLFVLGGSALWLRETRRSVLVHTFALSVVTIAGLTLVEYLTSWSLGMDRLLTAVRFPIPATTPPGRMGLNTALAFLLAGGSLLMMDAADQRLRIVSQLMALGTSALALIAVAGYAYSVGALSGFGSYTPMALHTALMLLVLGIGMVTVHGELGITAVIGSSGPGGILARRLLPVVVLGLLLLGWIRLEAQRAGLFGTELGDAFLVIASSILLLSTVLAGARRADRSELARRAAERETRENEERMRFALTAAKAGIWEADLTTDELNWSDSMAAVFGIDSDARPRTIAEFFRLVHPDDRAGVESALKRAVVAQHDTYAVEFRVPAGGATRWIYGQARTLDDAQRPSWLTGIGIDITERKAVETQLYQSQKLEAVGQLAGGVAHDLNNVLTAILGYADLLLEQTRSDDPMRPDLEEIQKAGRRASAITHQLLAFSRRQVLQPTALNVNFVITDLQKMLGRLLPETIQTELRLGPHLHSVKVDRTQFEQVVVNLAVNARDAMPQGGLLKIETANVTLDDAYQSNHMPVVPGEYVLISVTDTGIGMDAATQQRVFEPFFTTKELGRGTGLGLATVYGIVKQSNGYIWLYSELGHGTTFKIYLPVAADTIGAAAATAHHASRRGGSETILIVEDDAAVRSVARRILTANGYCVLEATNVAEAIGLTESHPEQIDLVLSDVIMPGSGHVSFPEHLGRHQPRARIMYMSGYADEVVVRHGVSQGIPFLPKPFSTAGLLEKVREVLDA